MGFRDGDICSSYARDYNLSFNSKKRSTVAFVKKGQSPVTSLDLFLEGHGLVCRQSITHLGITMSMQNSGVLAVEGRVRKFWGCQLFSCSHGWNTSE